MTPTLHGYQHVAAQWLLDHPRSALLLEPGLGKTLTTIYALEALRLTGEVGRVLLIAPLRVAQDTWPGELAKWSALHGLSHAVAVGNPKQRRAALAAGADVTITSVSTLAWLLDEYAGERLPFDTLVVDELSMFKSNTSQRFKMLKRHLPHFARIIGLTGTPVGKSLMDLWAQAYIIDQGEALGTRIGRYREAYFVPDKRNGHMVYSWALMPGADEKIYQRIESFALSMRAVDHLDLPPRTNNVVRLSLTPAQHAAYKRFVRDQVLELPDGVVTAANAAVLNGKLQQFTAGAVYDEAGEVQAVHALKLDAIREIVEGLQGSPVLIFYGYQHERDALLAAIPGAEVYGDDTLERWNADQVSVVLAHPASLQYGVNLQHGHTVIWATLPWSGEAYTQANARVDRQGQEHPVVVHHLVIEGTVDERVLDVVRGRVAENGALLDAMRAEFDNAAR